MMKKKEFITSAYVLLNRLNSLQKRDKILGKVSEGAKIRNRYNQASHFNAFPQLM